MIGRMPSCGYELVCPLFDGAIMRPTADHCDADKLAESVREMYNIHLRVSPFAAETSNLGNAHLPRDTAGVSLADMPALRSIPPASTDGPSDSHS